MIHEDAIQDVDLISPHARRIMYRKFGILEPTWQQIVDDFSEHCGPNGPILANRDHLYLDFGPNRVDNGGVRLLALQTINTLVTHYRSVGTIYMQYYHAVSPGHCSDGIVIRGDGYD